MGEPFTVTVVESEVELGGVLGASGAAAGDVDFESELVVAFDLAESFSVACMCGSMVSLRHNASHGLVFPVVLASYELEGIEAQVAVGASAAACVGAADASVALFNNDRAAVQPVR